MEREYKNKKRILIGIIIALILMNLSALGTWGYQKIKNNKNYKVEKERSNFHSKGREDRIKQYVKRELKLNESQAVLYCKSMDENFLETKIMVDKISNCKREIIDQTLSENPDTVKLSQLCDSLGSYHKEMQLSLNKHFLEVKKSLDTTQKAKLKEILIRMNEKEWNKEENQKRNRARNCAE